MSIAVNVSDSLRGDIPAAYDLPVIAFNNRLEEGVVTNDGTNPSLAYDWLTYDGWLTGAASGFLNVVLPDGRDCDYFAFAAHTIDEVDGTIKLQYDNGGGLTDVAETIIVPGDGKPVLVKFDTITANIWRVVVTGLSAAATIGVISFGERLDLERGFYVGFSPPNLARRDRMLNLKTQNGQFLGRSLIRTGASGSLDLEYLTPDWVRDDLDAFIVHSRTKGWFLSWHPSLHSEEVAYCWTTTTPNPMNSHSNFMSVSIPFEGIVE